MKTFELWHIKTHDADSSEKKDDGKVSKNCALFL